MLSGLCFLIFGLWHLQISVSLSTCSCLASNQWNTTCVLAPIQKKILKTSNITLSSMLSMPLASLSILPFQSKLQSINTKTSPHKMVTKNYTILATLNLSLWLTWLQVFALSCWWLPILTHLLFPTREIQICWMCNQSEFISRNFSFQILLDLLSWQSTFIETKT